MQIVLSSQELRKFLLQSLQLNYQSRMIVRSAGRTIIIRYQIYQYIRSIFSLIFHCHNHTTTKCMQSKTSYTTLIWKKLHKYVCEIETWYFLNSYKHIFFPQISMNYLYKVLFSRSVLDHLQWSVVECISNKVFKERK